MYGSKSKRLILIDVRISVRLRTRWWCDETLESREFCTQAREDLVQLQVLLQFYSALHELILRSLLGHAKSLPSCFAANNFASQAVSSTSTRSTTHNIWADDPSSLRTRCICLSAILFYLVPSAATKAITYKCLSYMAWNRPSISLRRYCIRHISQLKQLLGTLESLAWNFRQFVKAVSIHCLVPIWFGEIFKERLKRLFNMCPRIGMFFLFVFLLITFCNFSLYIASKRHVFAACGRHFEKQSGKYPHSNRPHCYIIVHSRST